MTCALRIEGLSEPLSHPDGSLERTGRVLCAYLRATGRPGSTATDIATGIIKGCAIGGVRIDDGWILGIRDPGDSSRIYDIRLDDAYGNDAIELWTYSRDGTSEMLLSVTEDVIDRVGEVIREEKEERI